MQSRDYHYLAVFSLILGIVGLIAWLLPICGWPISTLGLALGVISRDSSRRNLALAGLVLSALGLLLATGNAALGAYLGITGRLFQ